MCDHLSALHTGHLLIQRLLLHDLNVVSAHILSRGSVCLIIILLVIAILLIIIAFATIIVLIA